MPTAVFSIWKRQQLKEIFQYYCTEYSPETRGERMIQGVANCFCAWKSDTFNIGGHPLMMVSWSVCQLEVAWWWRWAESRVFHQKNHHLPWPLTLRLVVLRKLDHALVAIILLFSSADAREPGTFSPIKVLICNVRRRWDPVELTKNKQQSLTCFDLMAPHYYHVIGGRSSPLQIDERCRGCICLSPPSMQPKAGRHNTTGRIKSNPHCSIIIDWWQCVLSGCRGGMRG